jgi:hypothetical protein
VITYHGSSNQVALICKANAMHHRLFPMGTQREGISIEDWFLSRGELCTPCWETAQQPQQQALL